MIDGVDRLVTEPNLLRVMIQLRNWEGCHHNELKTLTGQELYFRIAETYLKHPGRDQHLKQLAGAHTERATRLKLREFEVQGLVQVLNNTVDHRTKRVIPTAKFLRILNAHLSLFKQICDEKYVMVDKNSSKQSGLAKDGRIHS